MKRKLLIAIILMALTQCIYAQSATILPTTSTFAGNVGDYTNNSTAASVHSLRATITSTTPGGFSSAIRGVNNGTGSLGIGIWGSHAGSGWGVYGLSPNGIGVYGNSTGNGIGAFGGSTNGNGLQGNSTNGYGVQGISANSSAGVFDISNSANGNTALIGRTNSTSSSISAINGIISSTSPGGFSAGVRGTNNGTGGLGIGVWGSHGGSGWGVYGSTPDGLGVYGNASGAGFGVYGNSNNGIGVQGASSNGTPGIFEITNTSNGNTALIGRTNSTLSSISAINGIISSTSPGGFSAGVKGTNNGTGGLGIGVWGSHGGSGWGVYGSTPDGLGVYGNASGAGFGVYGNSNNGVGVQGLSNNGTPGIFEITNTSNGNSALIGRTNSTSSSISAILGTVSSTSPGGFSAAVKGVNNGTGGLGIGVWGAQNGSGWGVYGATPNGLGVYGNASLAGTGIYGNSNTGIGIQGTSNNGPAGKFDIFNNANANVALSVSTLGDGVAAYISKSTSTGNGAGLALQKNIPFSGTYTTNPHTDLDVRHPTEGTPGMTGLRILNTGASLNAWTLYTVNSDGSLALYSNGVFRGYFNASTGAYTPVSDARLKNNIISYDSAMDKLMKVDVKSYKVNHSDKTEIGLLAQEVQAHFPEIVYQTINDKGDSFYTMDYSRIGVIAIKAIQEQQREINELKKEIAELKALIKR